MKRLLLFTLVATLFAACSKDGVNERNNDRSHALPDMLYASIDAEDATRVQLNELQKTVWTEGDRLSVFYFSNGNTPFEFNGKTGDREGGFRATSLVEGSTGIDKIVSIYPYSETYTMNTTNKYVSVKKPATQHYLEGSYGVGDNLIAYVGKDGTNLSHKNLCGWIKIQLTGSDTITKITLRGNDGEQLAGDVKFYYEDFRLEPLPQGGLIIGEYIETITLDCGNGVTLDAETPTDFYFVVAPQTFDGGFTVDIEAADGTIMTKSTTKTVTIERNHIQPMTVFGYQGIFKQANNEIWYTNGSTSNPTTPTGSIAFGGTTILSNLYDDKKECWVITFDKDVTTIGQGAFSSCTSLTSVTIPDSVTEIGIYAFCGCTSLTSINIPESVTTIGDSVFSSCTSLTNITIPDSVTTIGKYAFHECTSLTSVNIPCRIAKIEDSTFWECTSLTSVTIPDSVTSIGDCAFWECASLTNITIPESVTTIGEYAFGDCTSLTNITIPNSVTEIGQSAFNGCNGLTSVTIGNNVTEIGTFAFYGCSGLTSVTIPDSVTEIGGYTFSFCESLTSVTIPNVVTSIGEYAFQGCTSLTNITIPDSVTTIGNSAFSGCSSLTSICIPNGVTKIGNSAFKSCYALEEVYCKPTTPPTGGSNMFGSTVLAPDKIYVPSASVSAYKNATGWSTYADTIIGYDFETGEVVEELQKPITYDWYTEVTDGYYEIDTPEELIALSKLCNGDAEALSTVGISEAATFENATIDITADINLINYCNFEVGSWEPIGTFSGTFNGNNHTISNLYYNKTNVASASVGLFANVSNAFIRDITVDGEIHISGDTFDIGGIVARSSNTLFENCISSVDITSDNEGMGCHIGGVCGSDSSYYNSFSTFIACQSDAYIKNTQDEWEWYNNLGGIVGSGNYAKIIACIKQGGCVFEEHTQSYTPVGGICGYADYSNDFRIIACYSNTEIDGRMPGHILGACSYRGYYSPNSGTKKIKDCYYAGTSHEHNGDKGVGSDNYGGSTYSRDDGTARSSDIAAEIEIMNAAIEEWNMSAFHTCYYRYTIDNNNNPVLVHQNYL